MISPTAFLRHLENFSGVLFLTTNRVHTIDPAFESRIQLGLFLDRLPPTARRKEWTKQIEMKARARIPDAKEADALPVNSIWMPSNLQFRSLEAEELNGREIRNIVNIADALARHADQELAMDHLNQALESVRRFKKGLEAEKIAADGEMTLWGDFNE